MHDYVHNHINLCPVSQCPPVQLIEDIEQVDKETEVLKKCEVCM